MFHEQVEVVHTVVFADGPGGGNPCPIVLNAETLSPQQMRAVAQRFNQECGFVVSHPQEKTARLRYFVPEYEMSMCVHATVAAVSLLVQRGRLTEGHATIAAPVGAINVSWDAGAQNVPPAQVSVSQFDPVFASNNPKPVDVANALNIPTSSIDGGIGPVQSVSVSRPKLIVPITDVATLDGLPLPNEELWRLCEEYDTTGVYAVSAGDDHRSWFARQFPVRAGYPEDAATGVAAGALAGYLLQYDRHTTAATVPLRVYQGRAMGKPSILTVSGRRGVGSVSDIRVSGQAQTLSSESISIEALSEFA